MADQTVSILAILKDEISPKLDEMNKGLVRFKDDVEASDASSVRLTSKIARVTNRLLALQLALQNVNSLSSAGSLGKFKDGVEAASAGLTTFASVAGLFPNKAGVIAAAVLGMATAFQSLSKSIREVDKDTEEMAARQEKILREAAEADAARRTEQLSRTAIEQQKWDLKAADERRTKLERDLQVMRQRYQLAAPQESRAEDIQQAKEELAKLQQRSPILTPMPFGGGVDFSTLQRISELEDKIRRLEHLEAEREKALALKPEIEILDGQIKALDENLKPIEQATGKTQAPVSPTNLHQQIADLQALASYEEQLRRLNQQQRVSAATHDLGLTPGTELKAQIAFARERFEIDKARVELLIQNEDLLTRNGQTPNKDELIAQAQISKANLENAEAAERLMEENKKKAEEAGEEMREFYQGIAQGIGQAFAHATGELIDGLIEGRMNWKQFAAEFMVEIAKMIAEAMMLKAIMATLGSVGLNEGGRVGLARGGNVPGPAGINRDVVPAMLTPGEFVMRKDAADYYGIDTMAALNRMLIPPGFAEDRIAQSRVMQQVLDYDNHFAAGGLVANSASQAPQGPVEAVVVPSERAFERLLAGGRGAQLRFIERERNSIRAILGVGRR